MNRVSKIIYNSLNYKITADEFVSFTFFIYVITVFTVYVLPYFKYTVPYIVAALLMLISLPFLFFSRSQKFILYLIITSALLAFLYFTVKIPGDLKESMNEFVRNVRFFLPAAMGVYAINKMKLKARKRTIIVMLCMILYIIFVSLMALVQRPMLARELAEGVTISSNVASYRLENVGGFEFSYMVGVLVLLFLYNFIQTSAVVKRLLYLPIVVLGYVYIVAAQYTALLLMTTIFAAMILFSKVSNVVIKLLLIMAFILIIINLGDIFAYLSIHLHQNMLRDKFSWLAQYINGSQDINVLHSRPRLYLNALKAFIQSPVWGGASDIGDISHSYVFGLMASCGIIGLFSYLIMFFQTSKHMLYQLKEKEIDTYIFKIACLYCFILSIFNPIGTSFEIALILYFFIPVWMSLKEKSMGTEEE